MAVLMRIGPRPLAPATALALAAVTAVACTPNIEPGTYLCGPEGLCPEGQACNGPDGVCVLAATAKPFSCNDFADPTGDDQPSTGEPISVECAATPADRHGCLLRDDAADFFQLDVPAGCIATRLEVTLSFPLAFQPLGLQFASGTGEAAPVVSDCPSSIATAPTDEVRCLVQPVSPGGHYAFGIVKDGDPSCGGACAHNRYTIRAQLRL